MPRRGRQRDVAAVAVTEHERPATIEQPDEVAHLLIDAERTGMRHRSPVAAPVVAQHPERVVEAAAEAQQPGRPVHRAVHERDQRRVDIPGLV